MFKSIKPPKVEEPMKDENMENGDSKNEGEDAEMMNEEQPPVAEDQKAS